jgi:hypothetical protein
MAFLTTRHGRRNPALHPARTHGGNTGAKRGERSRSDGGGSPHAGRTRRGSARTEHDTGQRHRCALERGGGSTRRPRGRRLTGDTTRVPTRSHPHAPGQRGLRRSLRWATGGVPAPERRAGRYTPRRGQGNARRESGGGESPTGRGEPSRAGGAPAPTRSDTGEGGGAPKGGNGMGTAMAHSRTTPPHSEQRVHGTMDGIPKDGDAAPERIRTKRRRRGVRDTRRAPSCRGRDPEGDKTTCEGRRETKSGCRHARRRATRRTRSPRRGGSCGATDTAAGPTDALGGRAPRRPRPHAGLSRPGPIRRLEGPPRHQGCVRLACSHPSAVIRHIDGEWVSERRPSVHSPVLRAFRASSRSTLGAHVADMYLDVCASVLLMRKGRWGAESGIVG